jgi:hypothetical protein
MQRDSQLPPEILEALKPLRVLARSWPGKPDGINPSTVFRFKNKGIGGVRLRALQAPGVGWCSCWVWVAEFFSATGIPAAVPQVGRPRRRGKLLRDKLSDPAKPASTASRVRPANEGGGQ